MIALVATVGLIAQFSKLIPLGAHILDVYTCMVSAEGCNPRLPRLKLLTCHVFVFTSVFR